MINDLRASWDQAAATFRRQQSLLDTIRAENQIHRMHKSNNSQPALHKQAHNWDPWQLPVQNIPPHDRDLLQFVFSNDAVPSNKDCRLPNYLCNAEPEFVFAEVLT